MWHGSLSRHAGIVLVLYALLAGIAVIAVDLRLLLIPASGIALGLVAAGLVVFRPLRVHVRIPWPAQTDPEDEPGVIVVNGKSCPFLGYEQELLVAVGVRRPTELLSCSLLAVAALYVMLSGRGLGSAGSQIGAFDAEFICIAGCMVLVTCLRWFTERQFLRSARITFGSILGVDPGFYRSGVTYQFFDQNQERRGGKGPLPRHGNDNVVLVFYRPDDPDTNTIHGAFAFHQFGVELLPGRRKTAFEAGVQG
jgi:hypothetical protein